jgi:hypothetical protein
VRARSVCSEWNLERHGFGRLCLPGFSRRVTGEPSAGLRAQAFGRPFQGFAEGRAKVTFALQKPASGVQISRILQICF